MTDIYASQVEKREAANGQMETADVVLLTTMWVCLGIAFTLSIFICVVVSCRRVLVRSFKIHCQKGEEPYHAAAATATETCGVENLPDRNDPIAVD